MKNAVIAAVVAAVVAAASASATTIVVTSKTIKDGTIQTVDISAKAKRALKGNRGPSGAQGASGLPGATGPAGPPGPPGVQTLQHVTNVVSVPAGQVGNVTAECPAGTRPISGGFSFFGIISITIATATGWTAGGVNDLSSPTNLTAHAYCSPNVMASSAAGYTEATG